MYHQIIRICPDPPHLVKQVLQKGSQRSKETLHNDLAHALKLLGRPFQLTTKMIIVLVMTKEVLSISEYDKGDGDDDSRG